MNKFVLLREAIASVRRAGFEPQIKRGRHFKVRWTDHCGHKHQIVVAVSPSDHRAFENNRALLRRLVRECV
jgi:hypothetical protein